MSRTWEKTLSIMKFSLFAKHICFQHFLDVNTKNRQQISVCSKAMLMLNTKNRIPSFFTVHFPNETFFLQIFLSLCYFWWNNTLTGWMMNLFYNMIPFDPFSLIMDLTLLEKEWKMSKYNVFKWKNFNNNSTILLCDIRTVDFIEYPNVIIVTTTIDFLRQKFRHLSEKVRGRMTKKRKMRCRCIISIRKKIDWVDLRIPSSGRFHLRHQPFLIWLNLLLIVITRMNGNWI